MHRRIAALLFTCAVSGCAYGVKADGAPWFAQPVVVFTPDLALEASTKDWAERWEKATCINIAVGPNGLRIEYKPNVMYQTKAMRAQGKAAFEVCGQVDYTMQINSNQLEGCNSPHYTIGHEMAHALGAGEHLELPAVGLTSEKADHSIPAIIDTASLTSVCSQIQCNCFDPEDDDETNPVHDSQE
jgi:hypothetical protein